MSERKVVVPKEMLQAAEKAGLQGEYMIGGPFLVSMEVAIEAALRWLAENPIVPTLADVKEFHSPETLQLSYHGQLQEACVRWQRRMFLAPEPEQRPDLIGIANKLTSNANWRSSDLYHALLEEFRMGQEYRGEKG